MLFTRSHNAMRCSLRCTGSTFVLLFFLFFLFLPPSSIYFLSFVLSRFALLSPLLLRRSSSLILTIDRIFRIFGFLVRSRRESKFENISELNLVFFSRYFQKSINYLLKLFIDYILFRSLTFHSSIFFKNPITNCKYIEHNYIENYKYFLVRSICLIDRLGTFFLSFISHDIAYFTRRLCFLYRSNKLAKEFFFLFFLLFFFLITLFQTFFSTSMNELY